MSWIVEHIQISVHLTKFGEKLIVEHLLYTVSFGEKLIVEHLLYTVSIATNNRTPGIILSLRKKPNAFDY